MKKGTNAKEFVSQFHDIETTKDSILKRARTIGLLKRIRRSWARRKSKSEEANELFIFAMVVRTHLDYQKILRNTQDKKWYQDEADIERIWDNLCDLNDRLSYLAGKAEGDTISEMRRKAEIIDNWFSANFGSGLYSSPEMVCKIVECSICSNNIKSCHHIPGRLYDGIRCVEIPKDCELRSVSLVKVPRDKRCRIWPWQLEENDDGTLTSKVKIMSVFRIDDFISGNEWELSV